MQSLAVNYIVNSDRLIADLEMWVLPYNAEPRMHHHGPSKIVFNIKLTQITYFKEKHTLSTGIMILQESRWC